MPVDRDQQELALNENAQLWDRLVREPSKAYAAFCIFRDLGPTRTLYAAYRQWREGEEQRRDEESNVIQIPIFRADVLTSTPSAAWKRWAKNYRWLERAGAFDFAVEQQKRAEEREEYEKIRQKRAQQRLDLDEIQYQRILRLNNLLDSQVARPDPWIKKRQESGPYERRLIVEQDDLKVFETVAEQTAELESRYFNRLLGHESQQEGEEAVIPVVGEFRWVPDPAMENDPEAIGSPQPPDPNPASD